ncbi:tetratricopeptide repeat protein [Ideonella sp. BN130291]|uniref:tetratricopeptide repeat protein n=1 Tax=Ideonella sp. BN130291 TaxID=3112940 RepID=UPI002E272488|nr:tetratricopeptide repeat protein [Ideonella sp. BN130291]
MSALFLRRCRRSALAAAACAALLVQAPVTAAAPETAAAAPEPVVNSNLDAPLFYQLLLGEMELRSGEPGTAFQVILDAARRTQDEALFRRAVDIALQARAGDQALSATTAWRAALPRSTEALRYHVQLLMGLNRPTDAMEPLGALLLASPPAERAGLISSLPRLLQRSADHKQVATLLEQLLQPYLEAPETRTASRVAIGRMWLAADDKARAGALLNEAQKDDPTAPGPALLALDMLPTTPAVESVITGYLRQPKAEPMVRLAYVRALTNAQRYPDAVVQLEQLTREQPDIAPAWLTLGALHLELHHPQEADAALQRYVQVVQAGKPAAATPAASEGDDDDDDDAPVASGSSDRGLIQAWLLLSQAAEMRGDYTAAENWLAKVDSPQRALEVQTRRAVLLARQGKLREARALVQKVPERSPEDARAKLVAEAQVLRDVKRWREANEVLETANKRFPNDADLLYEQAMVEDKLNRADEMERLLRKVIEIKPDHHHAYNALGYSLADRNKRLPEAKALIEKALALSPGEPFITDSLGWVEYRLGRRPEALQLLRKAYSARPDPEIAAHLGEVLWVDGQRDEARKVLRDAKRKDSKNEVLGEVLARLKVDL